MRKQITTKLVLAAAFVFIGLGIASTGLGAASALETYRETFRAYRDSRASFGLAKERYAKLGTLAARDEALSATKEFLKKGTAVLKSYIGVLRERVEDHPQADGELAALVENLLSSDLEDYNAYQKNIEAGWSLARLEVLSEGLDKTYEEREVNAQAANAVLVLADVRGLQEKVAASAEEVRFIVQSDPEYSDRERILGEWYKKITNKLGESARVLSASAKALSGFEEEEEEDVDAKKVLVEDTLEDLEICKRLNLEVANHLLEIVRVKKY